MEIWNAFRETDEGAPEYMGSARTPEGARGICEAEEADSAASRTATGETTINADHTITRVDRTYTSNLVWADNGHGGFRTTNESQFAWGEPDYSPDHYFVDRSTLLD